MAEACQCDVRTIQRDLDLLVGQAQIPLEYDREARAYRLPDRGWTYPVIDLNLEDVMVLAFARGLLMTPGVPCQASVTGTLNKAVTLLPPVLRELLNEAATVFLSGHLPRDYSGAPLSPLIRASLEGKVVEIDYESRSRGGRSRRKLDPYAVEPRDGLFWELHGWCHENGAVRTFALDRIYGIRLLDETFIPRTQEWAAFTESSGVFSGLRSGEEVKVEVRFAPEVTPYVLDRRWSPSLSLESQEGGTVLLKGTVLGLDGIVPEILRWRRHAEVLGGPELRERMAEEVRALAAMYLPDFFGIPDNSESE